MISLLRCAASVGALLFISPSETNAADIALYDNTTWCDQDLPIYIENIEMTCGDDSDSVCSLGAEVKLTAQVTLNSGLSSDKAYLSLKMHKSAYSRVLVQDRLVYLCNHIKSNNGNCPSKGTYTFKTYDNLPSFGDKDWFLTGWEIPVELVLSSRGTSNPEYSLAYCVTTVNPVVTHGAEWGVNRIAHVDPPAAGKVFGIVAIVAAAFILVTTCMCLWMDTWEKVDVNEMVAPPMEKDATDFEVLRTMSSGSNDARRILE